MYKAQLQVRQFRREVLGIEPGTAGGIGISDAEFRARHLLEEAAETAAALIGGARARELLDALAGLPLSDDGAGRTLRRDPDEVAALDGGCDTLYVALGLFEDRGLDAEPFFDAVHDANMRKSCGPKEGEPWKAGAKPPGWVPPDGEIRRLLAAPPAGRPRDRQPITVADVLDYCESQKHPEGAVLGSCCCGFCRVANLICAAASDSEDVCSRR